MTKTIGDYIVLLVSIIGSFASILAFGIYFKPLLNEQGWVGIFFLGMITLFFLSYNYYLIAKYRKKHRYSEVFEEINVGFSQLHSIDRHKAPTIELIIQKLSFLCDSISNAFSKINGHHVGICIKFLSFENNRPLVNTLVRDSKSKTQERKTGTHDKIKHWLDHNSDFHFIYSNFDDDNVDTTVYYEGRLPIRKDYRNTRLKKWPSKARVPFMDNIIRRKT